MDVNIITKAAFAVIGREGAGSRGNAMEWVPKLWESAVPELDKIKPMITGPGWGLMTAEDEWLAPWTERGRYLAGWEVAPGTTAPEGWSVWEMPEATYAVAECTMATYGHVWNMVREEWLPKSGYEPAGPAHEHYPPEFKDITTDTFYLYFMVKKA